MNNLKQIGLALHNYHAAWDTSTSDEPDTGEAHGNGHTVFTAILPYMEQIAHLQRVQLPGGQLATSPRPYGGLGPGWRPFSVRTTFTMTTLHVPSRGGVRYPESRSTFAKAHYGANWGGGRGPWGEEFAKEKGTYLGVMMTVINADGRVKARDGKPRARNIGINDITDGTSFTLAIVEKRDSFGWAVGGWGGSEFDVHTAPAYEGNDPLAAGKFTAARPTKRVPTPRCAMARSAPCTRRKTTSSGMR